MKTYLTTLFSIGLCLNLMAQSPQAFNYQGVARDNSGNVLANQSIGVQVDLRETSTTGSIVYTETHSTTTNDFGLFNLAIGTGAIAAGDFTTIDWGNGPYFIEVSMDATGGTTYQSMGVSQLLSVPYALYAESSGNGASSGLWEELGTATAIGDANQIEITELAFRKHLRVVVSIRNKVSSCVSKMTFNSDDGNSYRTKLEVNNSIVEASTNVTHIKLDDSGPDFQGELYCDMQIINENGRNKLINYHTTILESNGSVPEITQGSAAWVSSEQINSIKVKACYFGEGSFISVYGHD